MKNKLYPLRKDLQLLQTKEDEQEIVIISDPSGYSDSEIAVTLEFFWLITQIEDNTTVEDLAKKVNIEDSNFLLPFIEELNKLDELYLLESDKFNDYRSKTDKEYINNPTRPSVLAEHSFPEEADEFNNYMNDLFSTTNKDDYRPDASSVIIPHLDLLTGLETQQAYSSSFHSIRNTDFDTIVIFGTAHYLASHRFMLSLKNFETPLGIIDTDLDLINSISEIAPNSFIVDEFAHKPEHSVEIQVALSSYYFHNRNFKILPILVSGYFDFMDNNINPDSDETINDFINALKHSITNLGRKPVFIASVDFSHIGNKFNDEFDAKDKLLEVETSDHNLIEYILKNEYNNFYNKINNDDDKWKVCGTAPVFTLLKSTLFTKAILNKYHIWYEKETKSAVSCAGISFYN